MPTYVHECPKRGRHTVCPECGRVAPDYCPLDGPRNVAGGDLPSPQADLPPDLEATPAPPKRGRKAKQDEEIHDPL